jgi:hypothetical protein
MLIAYYDPKTKDVRILCTDTHPAIALMTTIEEDMVIDQRRREDARGKVRAQMYVNVLDVPLLKNGVELAKVERKLKEALANHPFTQAYVQQQGTNDTLVGAQAAKTQDISADFARKP